MSKKIFIFSLIIFFSLAFLPATSFASIPRWPQPGWQQYWNVPTVTQPSQPAEPTQPTEPTEPKEDSADNENSNTTTSIPRWPQPGWQDYWSGNTTPAPLPQPEPQPEPVPIEEEKPTSPVSSALTVEENRLLVLVNQERASRGLPQLSVNSELVGLARMKSQDMVDNNYFGHNSPTYGSHGDLLRANNVAFRIAGENIARTRSADRGFQLFMNSSNHRRTLLNGRYTETGIGIVKNSTGNLIITQIFVGHR